MLFACLSLKLTFLTSLIMQKQISNHWWINQILKFYILTFLFDDMLLIYYFFIRSWIEREERRGMQVGSLWYLIASDWWLSWNEYVDYQVKHSSINSYSNFYLTRD